jgi:hypothetical protein
MREFDCDIKIGLRFMVCWFNMTTGAVIGYSQGIVAQVSNYAPILLMIGDVLLLAAILKW